MVVTVLVADVIEASRTYVPDRANSPVAVELPEDQNAAGRLPTRQLTVASSVADAPGADDVSDARSGRIT